MPIFTLLRTLTFGIKFELMGSFTICYSKKNIHKSVEKEKKLSEICGSRL